MIKRAFILLTALVLVLSACCSLSRISASTIQGGETRHLRRFTAVVLRTSADVDITVGDQAGFVVVRAKEDVIPLIETHVRFGRLVISAKPNASIPASGPIRIEVTTRALNRIQLSGSGNVSARDVSGNALSIALFGSGDITATGTVNRAKITLKGSGQVLCDGLKARATTVRLPGSGNVTVYASDSLDATISGSGNIRYSGHPAAVHKSVTGSGNIEP